MSDHSPMDVSQRIADVMGIDPAAPALSYEAQWWTWGDCREFGVGLETRMTKHRDPGEGTPVAVIMRNRPPHVASILAVVVRRWCVVPVSPLQSPERVAADLRALAPAVVLADAEDWSDEVVAATGAVGALGLRFDGHDLVDVVIPDGPLPTVSLAGTAVSMPTSGTTGPPKRVAITYRDLSIGFDRVRRYAKGNEKAAGGLTLSKGVVLSSTPLVHILGLWQVFQFAVEARRLVLLDRFEPRAWAALVAEHRPVVAMLPPTALVMLLDAGIPPEQLASLRAVMCGTAALAPDIEERFTERFGIPVLTTYGATEFPGGLVGWTLDDKLAFGGDKRGSVGRPRPGVEVRIVDGDSGQAVPPGTEGLIEVRSAQTVARGADGWVRTTDLGRVDDDGFVWVTGRADGAINRGGFKILPETIEAALLAHPAVRAAGALGVPDPRLGQVPVAAVEVQTHVTEAELTEWVRNRLLRYQVPVRIAIVDALPKTPSMKVSRPALRELLA